MKQRRPLTDENIRAEEVRSTQNLTALVTRSIPESAGEAEPAPQALEVPANTSADQHTSDNGHRTGYKVKWGRSGELILKGVNHSNPDGPPLWVRVITMPRTSKTGKPEENEGWLMKRHNKPAFTCDMPVKACRFGPRPELLKNVRPLELKLSELRRTRQLVFTARISENLKLKRVSEADEVETTKAKIKKLEVEVTSLDKEISGVNGQIRSLWQEEMFVAPQWIPTGPKRRFFQDLWPLERKLRELKKAREKAVNEKKFELVGGLDTSIAEIEKQIRSLELEEKSRRAYAKRLSRQKRPPKAERLKKSKSRRGSSSKLAEEKPEGDSKKKSKKQKRGGKKKGGGGDGEKNTAKSDNKPAGNRGKK